MSAYLIEVDDTEDGIVRPTVIGPFDDEEAAQQFADDMSLGLAAQGGQGGYSAVHVISDDYCNYTPERYIDVHRGEINESWASGSDFITAALNVTDPDYQALPFDEDLTVFEETGRVLLERTADMTASEFDDYCREYVDAPSFVVLPFLFKLRDREINA